MAVADLKPASGETARPEGNAVRERSIARDLAPALVLFAVAALLLAGLPWPCPFKVLTGLPCPSCGMTRAARFALHGDFASATRMHPLWPVVLSACAAFAIVECAGFARTRAWGAASRWRATRWGGAAIVALLVVTWLARFLGAFGGPVVG